MRKASAIDQDGIESKGPIKDFRVTIRVKNNRIVQRREELGLSQSQAARAMGVGVSRLSAYENLKRNPLCKDGTWRLCARRIFEFFGCLPDDLWPEQVIAVHNAFAEHSLNAHELSAALSSPESSHERRQLTDNTRSVLATLSPREEKVIRMRFGFGGDTHILEEIGAQLCVGRERIRQIEARALRKLRHPSRAKMLRSFW